MKLLSIVTGILALSLPLAAAAPASSSDPEYECHHYDCSNCDARLACICDVELNQCMEYFQVNSALYPGFRRFLKPKQA
jgi:hypothetical protein